MMTLDPDDSFFQEDNDSHSRDDDLKTIKDSHLYKDTMALLKRKMCTAQDLLEQFNVKVKEYNELSLELQETKLDKEKLFNKYNSASEKLTRLELSSKDFNKARDTYKCTVDKQQLELDEKRNYIEQLEFKIKEMEKDSFHLKDEIKKLQQESKISKTVAKKATKNQGSQTVVQNTEQNDASVNTDFKMVLPKKPQTKDKNIITDMTCTKKEPFPIFCSNCENHIESPPLGQILRIMSTPPPPSISNNFSPPCSPRSIPSGSRKSESIASHTLEQYFHDNPRPSSFDKKMIENSKKPNGESDRPSFMLIDKLTRKINNLERLVKKKKQKQNNSSHEMCCASKNIKFVVQLPNEEKYFEYAKRSRRKQTHVKRLNKKQIKSKNIKKSKAREWQVEDGIEIEVVESSSQNGTQGLETKNKKPTRINETNDLFESPPVVLSNAVSRNQASVDSQASGTKKTTRTESLGTLDKNTDKVIIKLSTENINSNDKDECSIQSSVSNPVLFHTSSHKNVVKEAKPRIDCANEKVLPAIDNGCNLSLNVLKKRDNKATIDLIGKNSNGNDSITVEFNKSVIIDTKNVEMNCTIIDQEETNDQATVVKRNSNSEDQDNCNETKSILSNIRKISLSSTSSLEDDELFSTSTICTLTNKNPHPDIIKHEHEQNSIEEVDNAEGTNALRSNDRIESSATEKVEVIDSPESPTNSIKDPFETQINVDSKIIEDTAEIEQFSDESLNQKCFAAKGKKRGKCSNVIDSDGSSEEVLEELRENKRRKTLIERRKQLLSKLNKLKTTSNYQTTSTKQTVKATESRTEITDTYIPTKKQRIAHVPKDVCEVKEAISFNLEDTICEVQKVESENTLTGPRLRDSRKKSSSTENLPQETKKLKLTKKAQTRLKVKKQTAVLDEEKLETIVSEAETEEIAKKDENDQINGKTGIKEDGQDENNQEDKEICEITGGKTIVDSSVSETVPEKTECTENGFKTPSNIVPDENTQNEKALDDSAEDSCVVKKGRRTPAKKTRLSPRKSTTERPVRRLSRRLQESSLPIAQGDANANNCTTDSISKESDADVNNSTTDIISEQSDDDVDNCPTDAPSTSPDRKKRRKRNRSKKATKQPAFAQTFDSTNSSLADTAIVSHFNDFLLDMNKNKEKENFKPLENNGKFIHKQLSLLVETEPLTTDVLTQVSKNLLNITPLDVVALVLVEFASTEYLDDIKCDTTYTPPAPPMTKFEQKIVTLIMKIKETNPEFMDVVEKGLQYKLFRLGKGQEVQIVERLFRILVILNKIKKDREKVRMLLCDALYCYNTRAMNIIHITLLCWSEVFPKHDSNNDILMKTIIHIVMSANVNRPFSKLMPLKKLLADYYGYPNCGFRVENFKQELMDNLKENVPGTNTAIILLCKSKGAEWALENIVKGLKHMIVNQVHPSMYDAITLLGDLLRPFSSNTLKSSLDEITNQLCDVLAGEPGSHDVEEGIVSCLLSIGGKFTFNREKIARCVLNWQPTEDLRDTTKEKFISFLKSHTAGWWRKFVQQNFPVADEE